MPDNSKPLEPTAEQMVTLLALLYPDEKPGVTYSLDSPTAANLREQATEVWNLIRDMVLEAVLDQIDEDRNKMAYGACGCAGAVRRMKNGDDELTEARMIENERQLREQGINSAADMIARSRQRLFPR